MITQEIRYTTTPDGVRIAWASSGKGPPLVKAANWLNHLEFDWESPVWRHIIRELAADFRLIRYDQRGNGLSDWQVDDLSFDAFVADLEAVVDAARLDDISAAAAVLDECIESRRAGAGRGVLGWLKGG